MIDPVGDGAGWRDVGVSADLADRLAGCADLMKKLGEEVGQRLGEVKDPEVRRRLFLMLDMIFSLEWMVRGDT